MSSAEIVWRPHFPYYENSADSHSFRYAVIILNQPVSFDILSPILMGSRLTICADGGVNRLYDALHSVSPQATKNFIPHYITGDMDSAKPEIVDFYSGLGAIVETKKSQYKHDFDKSWDIILRFEQETATQFDYIYALGALDGRFDQTLSNVNMLYKYPSTRLVLISNISTVLLLKKGRNTVHVN
eukprot:Sdes_comp20445_c0_seq1m14630